MDGDHQTWLALSNEQIDWLRALLEDAKPLTEDQAMSILERVDLYTNPAAKQQRYRDAAEGLNFVRDGECEIDDCAVVSSSDDGAYVMAWVWVDKADTGICCAKGCDEDADGGEGWNGLCGNCADRAQQEENEADDA